MEKRIILLLIGIAYFIGNTLFAANPGDTITLDLTQPVVPSAFTLDPEKGYWTETYNASGYPFIEFETFKFTHILGGFGGGNVGGGMSYWDGFTYCTSGDTQDYGELGNSNNWVAEQWGCMAGGGIATDANGKVLKDAGGKVQVVQGNPYLVAYWGYYQEVFNNGVPCLQALFQDNKTYEPIGVYVANHPWPYYGNIHGDGFARPFDIEGDYFKLFVHGLNANGEDVGITVEHILAEYKNGQLHQSDQWEWIDLSGLGTVSGIYFTMETTDADPIYGPNTAVYFCMDKLQVRVPFENEKPDRPTGLQTLAAETTIDFSWTASLSSDVNAYNVYLNDALEATVPTANYTFTGLSPYTSYVVGVEAVDVTGKISDRASLTVSTTDETPPSVPADLSAVPGTNSVQLTWTASTDNVGVVNYNIYQDGQRVKRLNETSYTLGYLTTGTTYNIEVEALDAADNKSPRASVIVTTITTSDVSAVASVLQVHPNPFADYIRVEIVENTVIEIYDALGKKVYSATLPAGKNTIDTSLFPKGMYMLHCGKTVIKLIK